MSRWVLILISIGLVGLGHRMNQPAPLFGHRKINPTPGVMVARDPPVQTNLPLALQQERLAFGDAQMQRVARFEFDARLLSTVWYSGRRDDRYSPVDLGIAWGAMSDSKNIDALSWNHGGRFLL